MAAERSIHVARNCVAALLEGQIACAWPYFLSSCLLLLAAQRPLVTGPSHISYW